ncbi:MAG: phosphohydrolase [Sulfuricurvum sp. PD_MW2]|jgi:HD-GYP domain-containing protein (c-di-GMP phosphodiesterase class II)|uniref:HD-GYP domain-containing protein n=1 Tax=Sulfuricurvum sp. PD_MW2 TaxID=2027917 RepID=UPI000C063230|nr:HD domain-containing phosphohydrolase [Sulfuricurvum sp. PD_MW2]PHM17739.1 MAG: phosphohydrolase [Sulfuricurvum sp. PD_MW2]
MKAKKYKRIDKRLITEGSQIDFNLFLPDETKTAMSLFLQSDTAVDGTAKVKLREIEGLYISEEDEALYQEYVTRHLQSIARNSDIPTDQKAKIVYEKATETIDAMFKNPESLENVKSAQDIVHSTLEMILNDDSAVESLMKITAHDYYTHTHSLNVSIYTLSLGAFLGIAGKDLETLGMAAVLHDLGKSKIDYEIINKNGKLTNEEFEQMKLHPTFGHEIALHLGIDDERVLSGIRHHHEKIRGGGYPDNLQGDQISYFARIIGVCDVFDALSTKRSYKDPMSSFESLLLMKQQMSEHLDMDIVNAFIKMLHKQGKS